MDAISQVIHQCETCAVIKQAKRVKPLWCGGRWLKYKYGEAWQIDYITLPQSRQGKRYVLTMVEVTTGWLETYPVPHATARNTILGLEKQVLWRHGTPEIIESDNGTHFRNNLIDTWAKEHGIEWVYHIPCHAPASGKIERVQLARNFAWSQSKHDEYLRPESDVVKAAQLSLHSWLYSGDVSWSTMNFVKFKMIKCRACTWERAIPGWEAAL
ncbi:hypothetical protein GRJ2_001382000 [Grus japonensis]|uniref:Integrase catalytic domain-containing protein n=1 Tax=Grus japonensis TaxID=30415 RepID=A0ABC9WVN2_GRUJA